MKKKIKKRIKCQKTALLVRVDYSIKNSKIPLIFNEFGDNLVHFLYFDRKKRGAWKRIICFHTN